MGILCFVLLYRYEIITDDVKDLRYEIKIKIIIRLDMIRLD